MSGEIRIEVADAVDRVEAWLLGGPANAVAVALLDVARVIERGSPRLSKADASSWAVAYIGAAVAARRDARNTMHAANAIVDQLLASGAVLNRLPRDYRPASRTIRERR